jgi:hypothetical protein
VGPGRKPAAVLAAALVLLAGCATPAKPPMTAADYTLLQDVLAQNPAARRGLEQTCLEESRRRSEDERAALGAVLDVDRDQIDRVFCERLVAAIARGEVGYADFTAMQQGSDDPDLMRRMLRALRQVPGQLAI